MKAPWYLNKTLPKGETKLINPTMLFLPIPMAEDTVKKDIEEFQEDDFADEDWEEDWDEDDWDEEDWDEDIEMDDEDDFEEEDW